MDFQLNEDQRALQAEARKFARNEMIPKAHEYDESEKFPRDIIEKAHAAGLINLLIPEAYGGVGLGMVSAAVVIEEIAAGCMGMGTSMIANDLALTPIVIGGTDEQKRKFVGPFGAQPKIASFCLTEPGSGSDAAGMATLAVKKGDKYVLNGSKQFITNGTHADQYTVFATTDKSKGPKAILCLVVPRDTPGVKPISKEKKMGQRASDTATISFEDCAVSESHRIGAEGEGFKIAMKTLDTTRPFIGASAVGMARAAMEYAIAYAKERKQFGQPIAAFQAVQFMLADMAMKIEASRLLTLQAAEMIDRGERASKESAFAKCFATDTAMEVTTNAVQIFGGYGYSREYPVEKIMRDAKLMQIYEGTNQIQRVVIARELLK